MLLVAGFSLGTVSCSDYLDKAPEADIAPTEPYKNYTNFQGFIEEIYNCIPGLPWHLTTTATGTLVKTNTGSHPRPVCLPTMWIRATTGLGTLHFILHSMPV